MFLKPLSGSVTEFACCQYRGWRRRAETKVGDWQESLRVVYDMTLGAARALG